MPAAARRQPTGHGHEQAGGHLTHHMCRIISKAITTRQLLETVHSLRERVGNSQNLAVS